MDTPPSILLGLAAGAAFALIAAGVWLLRQPGGNRVKAALMIVAGLVILFNGWINSLPVPAMLPGVAPA